MSTLLKNDHSRSVQDSVKGPWAFLPPLMSVLLLACTHQVTFLNVTDGKVITGQHHLLSRSITLPWPSGEILEGRYTKLTTEEIGEHSLFFGQNLGSMLGRNTSERFYGYARLQGDRGKIVEIVFASGWLGHGYGVAKTNDGEEYRISF
jgi:hypothetical protein